MKHLFLFLLTTSAITTTAQNVGIGTNIPGYPLTVKATNATTAISSTNNDAGTSTAIYGTSSSAASGTATLGASGVTGEVTATGGGYYSAGVRGINRSTSPAGMGVIGYHAGSGYAVLGETPDGTGVAGNSNTGTGGSFSSFSGVGLTTISSGTTPAFTANNTNTGNGAGTIYATGNSTVSGTVLSAASAIVGELTSTSGAVNSAALRGINRSTNLSGIGVVGYQAGGGDGVYGETVSGDGVVGYSGSGSGGYFSSTSGAAVTTVSSGTGSTISAINTNTGSTAGTIYGSGMSNVSGSIISGASAVVGELTPTSNGFGSAGVRGINRSTNNFGMGVIGYQAGSGYGVYGEAVSGDGVHGYSASGTGGFFSSNTGAGLITVSGGGAAFQATNIGTGAASNFSAGSGSAIIAISTGTLATFNVTNTNFNNVAGTIYGSASSTIAGSAASGGSGVVGEMLSPSGGYFTAGIRGINRSTSSAGMGVVGYHAGSGIGVYGETAASGMGVQGYSPSGQGGNFSSNTGTAIYANTTGTASVITASNTITGNSAGTIYASSGSTIVSGAAASGGSGVVGEMTATSGGYFSAGLRGINRSTTGSGMGVVGYQAGTGIGVYGETAGAGMGVSGYSPSGQGGNFGANSGTALVASSVGGIAGNFSSTSGTTVLLANSVSSGNIAVFQAASGNVARIDRTGKGFFNNGTQTGGADLAEAFAVEGNRSDYEPGDVLVISTTTDRTVTKSNTSYSTSVAGVYATKPGVLLTERMESETQSDLVPMGVVGVIPTKVCGENGPIHRGDLLVTSSIPGRAMKATQAQIQYGSVIGKALEDFTAAGNGLIKVLVNVR